MNRKSRISIQSRFICNSAVHIPVRLSILRNYLYACLVEQLGGQFRVEGRWHGENGQILWANSMNNREWIFSHLGADPPVLATHVAVQRVTGLGDGAAENAAVAGADSVLVLHVGSQGVR